MSKSWGRRLDRWENLLADILQVPLHRESVPLSSRDRETVALGYVLFAQISVDLNLLGNDAAVRLVRRMTRTDVISVVTTLKSLDEVLVGHWLHRYSIVTIARFKREAELPWIVNAFFPALFQYCQESSTWLFRRLHQAFSFLSRLSLRDIDKSRGMQDFLDRNNANQYRNIDYSIAENLRPIFRDWLSGLVIEGWGKHGPGSTADHGRLDPLVKSDIGHDFGYDQLMVDAFRSQSLNIADYYPDHSELISDYHRVCKLHVVPKNALKMRTIALERISMQYFQQIIRLPWYEWIDRNNRFIPIFHQEVNRRLAQEGSISGYYATVDLSAASDSVDWEFVRIAFSDTELAPWLAAARTTAVEVDGVEYPLNMFATMGSALCFPTECYIFAGLCELATKIVGRRLKYSVYGDDIIFPSRHVAVLYDLLERSGFTVNKEKSFSDEFPLCFRESCGGEFLKGEEVTPVRIPRRFAALHNKERSPGVFSAWVQLANRFFEAGLLTARSFLIRRLLNSPPYPVFGEGEHQLHTYVADNHLVKTRWNCNTQYKEALGAAISTVITEPHLIGGDDLRYWDWWRQKALEGLRDVALPYDPSYGTATRVETKWQRA